MPAIKVRKLREPAISVTRAAIQETDLVYIAVANKLLNYEHGKKSSIVYIGRTKAGINRIAQSAAKHAPEMLKLYGVKQLDFWVVSPVAESLRDDVTPELAAKKLESGLILKFRELFGRIPMCNTQGKLARFKDETDFFSHATLRGLVDRYAQVCADRFEPPSKPQ